MNGKILIVEDDVFLRDGLCELLEKEGYLVNCAKTIFEAETLSKANTYNLIILDIMLPDGSGVDLCLKWRREGKETLILFLTASDDEIQIVRGLDAGGDDYVTKPFRLQELLSRIRALIRRKQITGLNYEQDGLIIDIQKMTVIRNGRQVYVTPTEFQLLAALIKNSGRVLTRTILLKTIWDDAGQFIDDNTLSVHISRLREKIETNQIKTIRGVGYCWEEWSV